MKRLVCFSTGNFFKAKLKRSLNKEINLCSKLKGIDGIEIMLPVASQLNKYTISNRNLKFLKELKFNTIHAPFYLNKNKKMRYWNTKRYAKILDKIHKIYDKIEAKNINFHIHHIKNFQVLKIKNNFQVLKNKDYQYSIENVLPRHKIGLDYYKRVLGQNPEIGLVLDTTHALAYSAEHLKRMVKLFKKRIIYCHLSAISGEINHQLLTSASKRDLNKLNPIKRLKSPVVIETWTGKKDIPMFQKEIRFVRRWLS